MSSKYKNLLNDFKENAGNDMIPQYQTESVPNYDTSQNFNESYTSNYNANKELEEIKQMQNGSLTNEVREKIVNSKLPKDILQSFIDNPIQINTNNIEDNDSMTEQLLARGCVGSEQFKKITAKLDSISPINTKNKVNENVNHVNKQVNEVTRPLNNGAIDIDYLLYRINEMIDKKINTIQESITHNKNNNGLKFVLENNNKFMFVDNDQNVYECQMIYKGKNKVKKK